MHGKLFECGESVGVQRRLFQGLRPGETVMFEKVGEWRVPRIGEWFLSGAVPQAYYARNDLGTMRYQILRPVICRLEREAFGAAVLKAGPL